MPNSPTTDRLLTVGFLTIVFGVPLGQVAVELAHGERVQYTDLFRYAPTEENLRRFEDTLEEKSWFQLAVRPRMQRALLATLGDTGAKAVRGRGGWLFYRPGVRCLVEPTPEGAVDAIVRFRDQLAGRDIHLLVVPVPGKASIYPDSLTRRAADARRELRSPTRTLLEELEDRDVETVNLFEAFRHARGRGYASRNIPELNRFGMFRHAHRQGNASPAPGTYYLARDTHWTPVGATLAATHTARKLQRLDWAPERKRNYATKRVRVERHSDIVEMMQIPGVQRRFASEVVECEQVLDSIVGPMVPLPGARPGAYSNDHLKDTPLEASVLVLGDSFCRIYQLPEPRSLGNVVDADSHGPAQTKRLLPGSAGFPSLLARALRAPVDYLVSDGGAATDVRQKLSTDPELLERKQVVVWTFAERDIGLGREGWKDVPLPAALW